MANASLSASSLSSPPSSPTMASKQTLKLKTGFSVADGYSRVVPRKISMMYPGLGDRIIMYMSSVERVSLICFGRSLGVNSQAFDLYPAYPSENGTGPVIQCDDRVQLQCTALELNLRHLTNGQLRGLRINLDLNRTECFSYILTLSSTPVSRFLFTNTPLFGVYCSCS